MGGEGLDAADARHHIDTDDEGTPEQLDGVLPAQQQPESVMPCGFGDHCFSDVDGWPMCATSNRGDPAPVCQTPVALLHRSKSSK
jgi:hypothetical protein